MRHECPNRKQKTSSSYAPLASMVNEEDWDQNDEEAEVKRLAKQLAAMQLVSVAFIDVKQNKCTEVMYRNALFDSGSPVSFVRKSWVPFMEKKTSLTTYRSMGNKQ